MVRKLLSSLRGSGFSSSALLLFFVSTIIVAEQHSEGKFCFILVNSTFFIDRKIEL